MKIIKKTLSTIAVIVLSAFFVTNAGAYVIADATGTDWYYTPQQDFWGVSFDSGSGFIQSVTFDISSFPSTMFSDPVFDFDGFGNYNNSTGPVIGISNGLMASDITAVFSGSDPNVLRFNFVPGSFVAGDFFRFSADTTILAAPTNSTGAYFGGGIDNDNNLFDGLLFSVLFNNGSTVYSNFTETGSDQSSALIATAPVPEPSTILLFMSGLFGIVVLRSKKLTWGSLKRALPF